MSHAATSLRDDIAAPAGTYLAYLVCRLLTRVVSAERRIDAREARRGDEGGGSQAAVLGWRVCSLAALLVRARRRHPTARAAICTPMLSRLAARRGPRAALCRHAPNRAAALNFDDGTRKLLTHAAPVLRDVGLPVEVFLATGPMGDDETLWPDRLCLAFARTSALEVDLAAFGLGTLCLGTAVDRGAAYATAVERLRTSQTRSGWRVLDRLSSTPTPELDGDAGPFRMLSWDEARALASDGSVTLHPHSVTHPILSRCRDEKVEHEVFESGAALKRETGRAPMVFAYPKSRPQDFDERAKAALRRRGVRSGLAGTSGLAHRNSDPPRAAQHRDLERSVLRWLSVRRLRRAVVASQRICGRLKSKPHLRRA